jgi:hypothetical protein
VNVELAPKVSVRVSEDSVLVADRHSSSSLSSSSPLLLDSSVTVMDFVIFMYSLRVQTNT